MPLNTLTLRRLLLAICVTTIAVSVAESGRPDSPADNSNLAAGSADSDEAKRPTLDELKRSGYQRSRFNELVAEGIKASPPGELPQANLALFDSTIKPLLDQHCIDCHGPDVSEGNVRVDALDPDLLHGRDTDWWAEVFAVVTKAEMPPPDSAEMSDEDRRVIVDWLSNELHAASTLRRSKGSHSTFRRLTRYEYNYALQDLLGLPWDFAKDLPPESHSEDGFENSSELLHLSVTQFEMFHRIAREALTRATVIGDRPKTKYWGIAMQDAAAREWANQDAQIEKAKNELAAEPEKLQTELARLDATFRVPHSTAYYKQLTSGRTARAHWEYYEAKYAFQPVDEKPQFPSSFDCAAILPAGRQHQQLVVELGNQLPDEGTMRVTVRASRASGDQNGFPSLQLLFGWQASNEGRALLRVSDQDVAVTASPEDPQLIQWDVPLGEIYPRNNVRKTSPMGAMPSPSEYIRIANSSASDRDVQIDYVLVEAPLNEQWPPESHRQIFFESDQSNNELAYAREILQAFMLRAWRRPATPQEVDRKMDLFSAMRLQSESFEEAVLEVLATVLSSPQFLYVTTGQRTPSVEESGGTLPIDTNQLAMRLSLFLWCSIPDAELRELASSGELAKAEVLAKQVNRMLFDPRCRRFTKQFVHQWLNMELLEFVSFERQVAGFDPLLKEAMLNEPVSYFEEVLRNDASVLDFVHSNYAMVNERLAEHYGFKDVFGNHFRRIELDGSFRRGGLLTQAGMLAMNSDWPDSHPLKRAIWLLERLLNDPPPPPPPAVPQIDLADPEIAKMTLKERIEDHRNQAACRSCHTKIDPWGIAFENYDALGRWRDEIQGKPVDAASELFNHQMLDGMEGLKGYLLADRQDQFVQAMVAKLATYALGRPLGFEDRAQIDTITANVRRNGDGLRRIVQEIVVSDLFRSE